MIKSALAPLHCGSVFVAFTVLASVAGCTWSSPEPAPVFQRDGMSEQMSAPMAMPMAMAPRPDRRIVVRPGQSLRGLAHAYHVSEHQLVAVNHLHPPYGLKIGQHLLIPAGGGGDAMMHTAALPPLTMVPSGPPPAPIAMPPLAAASAPAGRAPDVIPLDGPGPVARPVTPPLMAQAKPPAPLSPPAAASTTAAVRPADEPSAAAEARAEAHAAPAPTPAAPTLSAHGGRFGWPVRGRVLAGYGVASGGARNDGINIAAPRGAPVAAVEGGEVAYAGNELKGYGNLVLIKHPDGYITAYAHCDQLLVKRGDKVSRGQVIAKVGTTGGVSEPQLHFELRRGKEPVDPKEFLAPAPSAGKTDRTSNG